MNEQVSNILVAEIRALRDEVHDFRDEVNSWRQASEGRISTLEAHDKDISGNGRAGRMTKAEEKLTRHDRVIWIGYGIMLTIHAVVILAIHYWPWGKH